MQKSVRLYHVIAAFTHPAAVLLSKIGVTVWLYRPPSPLGSFRNHQSTRIVLLGSGRQVIAAFTIDKMVISRIDVTVASNNSSSPGLCHENIWVLFSPTIFPAVGIHKGNGQMKLLDNEISWGVATQCNWWWPVTQDILLIVFCIYTSSGWVQETSGRWNTYQHVRVSCS